MGFDPVGQSADRGPHLGLSGMRKRLRLVSGSLQIESAPGAGTTLFIHIPLPPEGAA